MAGGAAPRSFPLLWQEKTMSIFKIKFGIILAASWLMLCSGCTNESAPSQNASESKKDPDNSYTLEEYRKIGFPDCDSPWKPEDFLQAKAALERLAKTDPEKLPRFESSRSGKLFARMAMKEDSYPFQDESLSLETRMPDSLLMMDSLKGIAYVYAVGSQHGKYSNEVIELSGSELKIMTIVIKMVNEFIPRLDKNDPTYPVRMNGVQKMKNGLMIMAEGSIQMLSEREAYRKSELQRLLKYMQETFPAILSAISPEAFEQTLDKLTILANDPKMNDLKPEIDELVKTIEQADKARKASGK
jgi:hypothetical protein